MRITNITLIVTAAIIIAACSSTKKSLTSAASSGPVPTKGTTVLTHDFLSVKPANGIYAPGNEELAAIQRQYKDVTLDNLKKGHIIYTEGACVQCHGAESIYKYAELQWKNIIEDMAQRAKISDTEKDAVYKYVLAIKAARAK